MVGIPWQLLLKMNEESVASFHHITRVSPKSRISQKSVGLDTSFALKVLKEHRARQEEEKQKAGVFWQEHDYVFCTSLGTHLNPTKDILDRLKAFLKEAGLPDSRFHDLRQSAATILLSLGVHPKVVQELLGHNQISMTMDIYSHVLPGMQRDAMAKLNDALQEPPEHEETGNDEFPERKDERHLG